MYCDICCLFLVIEVSPIIIERGMRSVGCLTREVLPETLRRRSVSHFNEYTETHLSALSTQEARALLIKHEVSESVSRLFAHVD